MKTWFFSLNLNTIQFRFHTQGGVFLRLLPNKFSNMRNAQVTVSPEQYRHYIVTQGALLPDMWEADDDCERCFAI